MISMVTTGKIPSGFMCKIKASVTQKNLCTCVDQAAESVPCVFLEPLGWWDTSLRELEAVGHGEWVRGQSSQEGQLRQVGGGVHVSLEGRQTSK
jgi:hypothetical protein